MQFQRVSILPPQKGLEFPVRVGRSVRTNKLKKCMKLNWNFRGVEGLRKTPFHGGGMDIFCNYTVERVTKRHNNQRANSLKTFFNVSMCGCAMMTNGSYT